jgi:branched-chain amino acid aminotransferase
LAEVNYAFFDKQFIPLAEAKIGIMTHALHYGTACFGGIRGNWNDEQEQIYLFRLKDHFDRFRKSCYILRINLLYSINELCHIAVQLGEMNGYREDIYLRPLAYKSSQQLGVRLHQLEDSFFMLLIPWGPYLDIEHGAKCCVSSWRRIDDTMSPPRAKICGLYVNSAFAKTEAWENGFDEAIMLSQDGHVSEGSGENIFIVSGGSLLTPPSYDNILMGITRNTIIELAKSELGMDTIERPIDRSELYIADECFLTGTAAHVTPIIEIDHHKIGDGKIGEVTKHLQQIYLDIIRGKNPAYSEWCTPVYRKLAKVP